ncbi:MAG TPA: CvpA family protein, partial [Chloroflexia bacterium]|nr:CvpA family protein [Chloroflexia bacterium]
MSGFSWPDLLVIAGVGMSAWAATRRGFVAVLLSLAGFVLALLISFTFYQAVAAWLSSTFNWNPVWTVPLAFLGLWVLVEAVFGLIETLLIRRFFFRLNYSPTSRGLAVLPGAAQGLVGAAVFLTMLALIPIGINVRNDILNSPIAGRLVDTALTLERPLEGIFGPAAREALGFITVRPPTNPGEGGTGGTGGTGNGGGGNHEEAVTLNFTVDDATADPATEEAMLALVNRERASRGLEPLVMDSELVLVARAHGEDMFKRGYFAHDTPEGVDPFQRMDKANIQYRLAGENLALAPTLDIAHNGLMNSPGHRANILKDGFRKVGIGVLDG